MAAGWQVGGVCYPSASMAAATACAGAYGVTNSGLLSCSSFTVAGDVATLTLSTGLSPTVNLMPCERLTFADTWGPLFGALLVGTVVIWGMKQLITPFRIGGVNE